MSTLKTDIHRAGPPTEPKSEMDAMLPFGEPYVDGKITGTRLKATEGAIGVSHLHVSIPDTNNAAVPSFSIDGEKFNTRVYTHPLTGKRLFVPETGIGNLAQIGAWLKGHIIHFSKGMAYVNAILAPLARQITNSTGLVTSGNFLLMAFREFYSLTFKGGSVAKISTVIKIPGMSDGSVEASPAKGSTSVGPTRPTVTGD